MNIYMHAYDEITLISHTMKWINKLVEEDSISFSKYEIKSENKHCIFLGHQ